MSTLTPFGVEVRKHRLDRRMRLLDLARLLDRTSAFVSAIETGRKPIPSGYVEVVAKAMSLDAADTESLQRAADRTRREVRLDKLPHDQRELVAAFARKVDELPADLVAALRRRVLKSLAMEIPFHRRRPGILVRPMDTKTIRDFAEKVRAVFVDEDQIEIPIIDILEMGMPEIFDEFYLDVQDHRMMGDEEGRMVAGKNSIVLREDVYEGACNGNRRARFTCCHELGHFLLHREVTMARTREEHHKIFYDSEWQADTFAGTLLMSWRHLYRFAGPKEAADKCNMTLAAASVMWSKYSAEGYITNRGQSHLRQQLGRSGR